MYFPLHSHQLKSKHFLGYDLQSIILVSLLSVLWGHINSHSLLWPCKAAFLAIKNCSIGRWRNPHFGSSQFFGVKENTWRSDTSLNSIRQRISNTLCKYNSLCLEMYPPSSKTIILSIAEADGWSSRLWSFDRNYILRVLPCGPKTPAWREPAPLYLSGQLQGLVPVCAMWSTTLSIFSLVSHQCQTPG